MERSEWDEPVDGDVAPVYPAAPIPLHERSWRHPSELGATSSFVAPPTQELHRGVLIFTSLVGLACVIGLALVLLPGDPPTDPVTAGAGSTGLAEGVATTLTLVSRAAPWIGIDCDERDGDVVVVEVTTGSPADSSGIRAGDVIVAVDGAPLGGRMTLGQLVERTPEGGRIDLTIRREGTEQRLTLWRASDS